MDAAALKIEHPHPLTPLWSLRLVVPLALSACAQDPEPPSWDDPSADDDWSELVELYPHEPEWTADEVVEQIETALSSGLPSPPPIFDTYAELMTHATESCPGSTFNGGFLLLAVCTTEEGYQFSGAAGLTTPDERIFAEDGSWTGSISRFSSPFDYVIGRPDGTQLIVGGTLAQVLRTEGDTFYWSSSISGTFRDEGAEGWLGSGFSGGLQILGSETSTELRGALDGSMTTLGVSLQFFGVYQVAGDCPGDLPTARIKLRQHDSRWYTLILDDPCGECGELIWDDQQSLGPVCVDLSALHAGILEAAAPW